MRNFNRVFRSIAFPIIVAVVGLAGCDDKGIHDPVAINIEGTAKMRITMQVNPDLGVHSGEVTISKGDMVYSETLEFNGVSASVLFTNLQPGIWLVEVELRDEDGYVLYQGSGEAGVVGGQTNTATIVVEELSGDLEVIVELPEGFSYYFALDAEDIAALLPDMSDNPIDSSDGNGLEPGSYLVYRTHEGRYGKFIVEEYGSHPGHDLTIGWVTYRIDGSVYSSGSGLVIHGTWSCDLEQGVEIGWHPSSEFWWEMMTETRRQLSPQNWTIFSLMFRAPEGSSGMRAVTR